MDVLGSGLLAEEFHREEVARGVGRIALHDERGGAAGSQQRVSVVGDGLGRGPVEEFEGGGDVAGRGDRRYGVPGSGEAGELREESERGRAGGPQRERGADDDREGAFEPTISRVRS